MVLEQRDEILHLIGALLGRRDDRQRDPRLVDRSGQTADRCSDGDSDQGQQQQHTPAIGKSSR